VRLPTLAASLLLTVVVSAQQIPPPQTLLVEIGKPDRDGREFALGPAQYRRFELDGVFVAGSSDPAKDWPYVHPGTGDAWAGSRRHAFRMLFGLAAAPTTGEAELTLSVIEVREWGRTEIEVAVNGKPVGRQVLPKGTPGAPGLEGSPEKSRPYTTRVRFPVSLLTAGTNELVITSIEAGWFVYDYVALHAPGSMKVAPVGDSTRLLGVTPTRALSESQGASFQPLSLSLLRTGPPATVPVSVDGREAARVDLRQGLQNVDVLAPSVSQPRRVSVEVAGQQLDVMLKPVPKLTIYVVPHSHTDIGYTHLQPEVEQRQIDNLEKGMALAERTASYPEGARFVWNVEVLWAADLFLQREDAQRVAAFESAVRKGHVALNGLYLNTLTGLSRPEEQIQNFRFATQLSQRLGISIDTAMISDVPGHSWGLVSAMTQAGIRYFSTSPNFFDRIGTTQVASADQPFWWVGPSGRDRVLTWNSHQGYALSHGWNARLTRARAAEYLDHLDEIRYPYEVTYIRWSGLGDNAEPEPTICEFVKDWNARYAWPRFVISDQRTPFVELERRYRDKIPARSGDWTPYWEDGAASSARETVMNRQSADRMTQAQALWAMTAPDRWPSALADEAWKKVLLYTEHTWGAHNSISEPELDFVTGQWAIKRGYAEEASTLATRLMDQATQGLATAGSFDVVNTLSWTRTDVVRVASAGSTGGDRVLGPDGKAVPSQRLATGDLAVLVDGLPPFSARRFRIVPGQADVPRQYAVRVGELELANGRVSARVDEATGGVTRLEASGSIGNYVDAAGGEALNRYLFMTGSDAAHPQSSGSARITVVDRGPLVATLRAESAAPGARRLIRDVTLTAGADRVDLETLIDKLKAPAGPKGDYYGDASKESVSLAFPFAVEGGQVRMELPLGGVIRPDIEQIAGSCKNWFTIGNWADVSAPGRGVTLVSLDAPLLQVGGLTANLLNSQSDPKVWRASAGSSTKLYPWLMNNHWGTNYRAYQEGPVAFRFALRPHQGYDPAAATRVATGLSQPLLVLPAMGQAPSGMSRLRLNTEDVVVTGFKPADNGKGWIVRLYNVSGQDARVSLTWSAPVPSALHLSGTSELAGAIVAGPVAIPAWGVVTIRANR